MDKLLEEYPDIMCFNQEEVEEIELKDITMKQIKEFEDQ